MARKPRETTSVSTLVVRINELNRIAKASGKKDLEEKVKALAIRVEKFAKEYIALKGEIDPLVKQYATSATLVEIDF